MDTKSEIFKLNDKVSQLQNKKTKYSNWMPTLKTTWKTEAISTGPTAENDADTS